MSVFGKTVGVAATALLLALGAVLARQSASARDLDAIERQTGFRRIEGERFITDLKYRTTDNFLHRDVYSPFGIAACYAHPDLEARLRRLEPLLRERHLKLVLFDCYRPIEVQRAMWKIMPNPKYVADPTRGSLHNRGVAVDAALADEEGRRLEFPTKFDSFDRKAWQNYSCSPTERTACDNRETLKELMRLVGLDAITSEWWHFHIRDAKSYPIVPLDAVKGAKP